MSKWRVFCKRALEIELTIGAVIAILASCAALVPGAIILCGVEFVKDRMYQYKGVE